MKIILRIFLILSPIFSLAQEKNETSHITAITHVNVIDATGSPVRSDMTIIIEGNRITTLDKTSKVKIPKTAFVINGYGKYLIPGLWDMHFHVFNNVSKTPPDENDFSLLIAKWSGGHPGNVDKDGGNATSRSLAQTISSATRNITQDRICRYYD